MTVMQDVAAELDITSDLCPMTFVRTRLALDRLAPGQLLLVRLKGQEPATNVPRSVLELGHELLDMKIDASGVSHLLIRRAS